MPSHVIVIGAGVAGLVTARRLAAGGIAATVLEARERVGGRIETRALGRAEVELGAAGLTSADRRAVRLCRELDVALEPADGPSGVPAGLDEVRLGGRALDGEEIAALTAELWGGEVDPPGHESVAQWLRRTVRSPAARDLAVALTRGVLGLEPGAADAATLAAVARRGRALRPAGGAATLPEVLAAGLDVRLEEPVVSVRTGRGVVRVETASGVHEGTFAVVTVPPPALASIPFDPPLADDRVARMLALRRGRGGVVAGVYDGGSPSGSGPVRVLTDGPCSLMTFTPQSNGTTGVTGTLGGAHQRVLMDPDAALGALDAAVADRWGTAPTRLEGAVKDWTIDPAARTTALVPFGDQRLHLPVIAHRAGRLYFAGDATELAGTGTLEGAVRSGERVAAEILERPGPPDVAGLEPAATGGRA